jgi:peptidoglycan/xylan/chitin deacetylase (PgdA/CDA1 family)
MKNKIFYFFAATLVICCNEKPAEKKNTDLQKKEEKSFSVAAKDSAANALTILQRPQVPILCYHRIDNNKPPSNYNVTIPVFKEQLKMLADSGYHSILPDQLYDYLTRGVALPSKPFMLTFDDTREEQFSIAAVEMEKYGFKGVFFIMTISINRPNYMSSEQLKKLSDRGHVISAHTWDHQNVKKLKENDWTAQIEKPNQRIQAITGKPVNYFAYPFGLWSDTAIAHIKKYAFRAAFQLSAKRSETEPLYTIRRTLVPGTWSAQKLLKRMDALFNGNEKLEF